MKAASGGIYVHIPFCLRKCVYCDFYSTTDLGRRDVFLEALDREIRLTAQPAVGFDTLYFGGGTPSLLEPDQVHRIIAAVRSRFNLSDTAEITLEVNPGTVDADKLAALRRIGVNRLNIGVQSLQDGHLTTLGRVHTAEQAAAAIQGARRAGFDNLGLDLIYGLPGQTMAALDSDLDRLLAFEPEHLSCYLLTYEDGTALQQRRAAGVVQPLGDALVADMFLTVATRLKAAGYDHYEISNFARDRAGQGGGFLYTSRHNCKYWSFAPYIGFGPAAHSFLGRKRFWNHAALEPYLCALAQDRLPVAGSEQLNSRQLMTEAVYLGLRQAAGIATAVFLDRFGVDLVTVCRENIRMFEAQGWMRLANGSVYLTPAGMLYLDSIAAQLIQDLG